MNKITREHYPVSKLPEDLRKDFAGFETVRLETEERTPLTGTEALAALEEKYRERWAKVAAEGPIDYGRHRGRTTVEEAVARVRKLRDEWDDE